MFREDNSTKVFIQHTTLSGALADNTVLTDHTLLEEGEIAVVTNADNQVTLATEATTASVRIVQRIGSRLVQSADFLISDASAGQILFFDVFCRNSDF